jgi:hypothetical protein
MIIKQPVQDQKNTQNLQKGIIGKKPGFFKRIIKKIEHLDFVGNK